MQAQAFDVCVRGAGAVGMSLALALSRQGLQVALVQPGPAPGQAAQPARPDVRAYALNAASRALLARLKVWDALPADAVTPVLDMKVHGDAAGSAIHFSAWTQAVDALAWIVDAAELEAVLRAALRFAPHVQLTTQEPAAPLRVLAEGKHSPTREQLGVAMDRQPYGQTALAARLVSSQPHAGVAWQWFRSPDVLALLPFDRPQPGNSFGLVWSLPHAQAQHWLQAEPAALEAALNQATGGAAGTLRLDSERAVWPLQLAQAEAVVGPGWALVGDAAHVVHPLAGQGLNLGLADVECLARVLAERAEREPWRPLDDPRLLARYARERAAPTRAMALLTDGLLHLFASEQPLVKELRNRGLSLLDLAAPLKRTLTSKALGA